MRHQPSLWLGALVLAAGLALLVERLVVTDAEAVTDLVERAAEAVKEGDFEALADTLAPGFTVEGRTAQEAVDWIRRLKRNFRPLGIEAEVGEVEVTGDEAAAPTRVTMTVMARPVRLTGTVHCRKEDGDWRIAAALLVPGLP